MGNWDERKHKRDELGRFAKMSASELSEELKQEVPDKKPFIQIQLFANKNLSKMGIRQLEKSVASYRKRIDEHRGFISNPLLKYTKEEWDSFSEARREREFAHWMSELKAFRKNLLY